MPITRHYHESPLRYYSMARSLRGTQRPKLPKKLSDRVTRRKWPVHLFFIFISACFSGPDFERWPSLSLFGGSSDLFLSNFIFYIQSFINQRVYLFFYFKRKWECMWCSDFLSTGFCFDALWKLRACRTFWVSSTKGTYELVISVFETP